MDSVSEMSVCHCSAAVCLLPCRQCPVPGCRAPLRWISGPRGLSAVSGSKEHLAFLRYVGFSVSLTHPWVGGM